jgi:hypothetical protein
MKATLTNFQFTASFAVALLLGVMTAANGQSTGSLPLIQLNRVPIITAIEVFARQSGLNFLIDPKLFPPKYDSKGNAIPEPMVTLNWTNISARDALLRLLKEHDLILVEDSFTTVALITSTNHIQRTEDASLLGSDANRMAQMANGVTPMFHFAGMPLDQVLKTLIEEIQVEGVLDEKVSGYVNPADNHLVTPPDVSFRWENITPKQAIVALCENFDLVIVKDSAMGVIRIKPKD